MGDRQAAQALKFISALRDQLNEMRAQLTRLERNSAGAASASMASARRVEAATLRRDIKEAQALVDQLRNRYLNDDPAHLTAMTQQVAKRTR